MRSDLVYLKSCPTEAAGCVVLCPRSKYALSIRGMQIVGWYKDEISNHEDCPSVEEPAPTIVLWV